MALQLSMGPLQESLKNKRLKKKPTFQEEKSMIHFNTIKSKNPHTKPAHVNLPNRSSRAPAPAPQHAKALPKTNPAQYKRLNVYFFSFLDVNPPVPAPSLSARIPWYQSLPLHKLVVELLVAHFLGLRLLLAQKPGDPSVRIPTDNDARADCGLAPSHDSALDLLDLAVPCL